jgi:hypothetical protein
MNAIAHQVADLLDGQAVAGQRLDLFALGFGGFKGWAACAWLSTSSAWSSTSMLFLYRFFFKFCFLVAIANLRERFSGFCVCCYFACEFLPALDDDVAVFGV